MIGLNFYRGSPRYVDPVVAREIVSATPRSVRPVGIFVDATSEEVRQVAKTTGIASMQLHGNISPEMCRELARDFRVIRAFSMDARFRPEGAALFPDCDVLLDAHHPELRGGTGLICDWPVARVTRAFARFLILSGGLNAQNVRDAIAAVAPHAVDVCSGVESAPGIKDYDATVKFVAAVRAAEHLAQVHSLS
jgi:phosphoribosylanthranilate isomerase